jgi:hypothetical protein
MVLMYHKLFEVNEKFTVKGRGLFLICDIPPSQEIKPCHRKETVLVIRPDQSRQAYSAIFELEHFSLVDHQQKYAFVLILPTATSEDVPAGSQILGSEIANRLLHGQPA